MSAADEIEAGQRFGFGENWSRFLATVDERRITDAEESLRHMLGVNRLDGLRFLDIGSGSGLFSLAARRLGAEVHSFDFDPQSVACTQELKRRFYETDDQWTVEQGSVLDGDYLEGLGEFDVVYSWGVLHHTGAMWLALENAIGRVAPRDGRLFIAIYNDQGMKSHIWWIIKYLYNRLPRILKRPFAFLIGLLVRIMVIIKYTLKLKPMVAIKPMFKDDRERGMSAKYDALDWVGGFPFEFSTFETLLGYLQSRGFSLVNARRDDSQGCNELAVVRSACAD